MSALSDIRAAIVAALGEVPNIGAVHAYERFASNEKAFRELYARNGKLLGWHVRRVSARESGGVMGVNQVVTQWRIGGLMALDDAGQSEIAMDNLVEAARDRFRPDETLGGVVVLLGDLARGEEAEIGIQVEESGPAMFCGVLCHAVRLGLVTTSIIQF